MKQTFGSFIKEKRIQKMLKLNAFAKQIGISSVYLSYLENGKRPAPSRKVLDAIILHLLLDSSDAKKLFLLAAETHHRLGFPDDLIDYINENECVQNALRIAKDYHISEKAWMSFIDQIRSEYSEN